VLKQIEVRVPRLIQCDNLAINYRIVGNVGQCFEDQGILSIEGIPPPGKKIQLTSGFHGDGTVAIEFNLFCGVRRYVARGCGAR
jgi:hypothetical protein